MLWFGSLGVQEASHALLLTNEVTDRDRIRVELAQTLKHLFNEWPDP